MNGFQNRNQRNFQNQGTSQYPPITKTVRFNTLKVIAAGSKAGKSFAAN